MNTAQAAVWRLVRGLSSNHETAIRAEFAGLSRLGAPARRRLSAYLETDRPDAAMRRILDRDDGQEG